MVRDRIHPIYTYRTRIYLCSFAVTHLLDLDFIGAVGAEMNGALAPLQWHARWLPTARLIGFHFYMHQGTAKVIKL